MNIGDAKIVITAEDKASAKLNAVGTSLDGVGKKATMTTKSLIAVGVAIAAVAIGMSIKVAKMAADFDMAMREVYTMLDITTEQFETLKDEVQGLSREMGISSTALSNALYQVVSAGIPAAEAIAFLGVAGKLAVAGVTETETAVDGLTTVMNAFKIPVEEAERVADILFATAMRGKTNIDELSKSMFQVAPIAAAAGIEFGIVAAALATITKQGTPTNVAATQLREAIRGIILPSTQMAAIIEEAGYQSGETMLAEIGLAGALDVVSEAAGGSVEKMGELFGSAEAVGAVLSLTGINAATFAEDIKATTTDAAGSVETAYGKMNEGVGRQYEILFNQIKVQAEEIGELLLPVFRAIAEELKPMLADFSQWIKDNDDLVESVKDLVGVLKSLAIWLARIAMAVNWVTNGLNTIPEGFSGGGFGLMTPETYDPTGESWNNAGGGIAGSMQAGGGGSPVINVGTFVGNESAFQEFARTIDSAIGQNTRRTSFGTVNPGYYGGTSAP